MQETSVAAYESVQSTVAITREQVYEFLRSRPLGATDEQVQDALDMNPSTERPRRGELVKRGRVQDSGDRLPTRSGCLAIVWEATR